MPTLQAHNISHRFDNGETLFKGVSCSLQTKITGLVGRNGAGKSIFISILNGQLKPSSGAISSTGKIATFDQLPTELQLSDLKISDFLKVSETLEALQKIAGGDCDPKWFDAVGDNWDIKNQLLEELASLGLPLDLDLKCNRLSGGELSRLRLWSLFNQTPDILILDEPTNHLDTKGRKWLIEQIDSFEGKVLLVSHDRDLLRNTRQIWELSSLGLTQYGGNYDFFVEQKKNQVTSIEKQLKTISKQQMHLEQQTQRNKEKADKRNSQGNKVRARGGQPKILLNGKRSSAESSAQHRSKNENHRQIMLTKHRQQLLEKHEVLKTQKLHITGSKQSAKTLLRIIEGELPFGNSISINITVTNSSKLHLIGDNGSGKSTLLKVLKRELALRSGELRANGPVFYLDQHFSMLQNELNLLDNLTQMSAGIQETDARTLLSGIGFKRDSVYRKAKTLSGGEKMKLALLIVSHHPEQPLLLLDEPDNHLDLDSKQLLSTTLNQYLGAFILVTHDAEFASDAGVSEVLEL